MKTLKKVPIEPVHVKYIPEIMEFGKLYISKTYQTCVHLCLCGCGNQVVTQLHPKIGWTLTEFNNHTVTLSPSIGNYRTCGSHYIIRKNIAHFV